MQKNVDLFIIIFFIRKTDMFITKFPETINSIGLERNINILFFFNTQVI